MTEGDKKLIYRLENLLAEAKAGEFGDFTNNKYPAPKMELAQILHEIREEVINGQYD